MMNTISLKWQCLFLVFTFAAMLPLGAVTHKSYRVQSPDRKISITIETEKQITWQINHEDTEVILPSAIAMKLLSGEVLGSNPLVTNAIRISKNTSFDTPFYKKSSVTDHYNQLTLQCKGNYAIEFRAYNDGAAYRFVTSRKKELVVANEQADFNFGKNHRAFIPYINDMRDGERYTYSFESFYDEIRLSEMTLDSLAITPLLIDLEKGKKTVIMEAGVEDYPGMFVTVNPQSRQGLQSKFAPYPLDGKMAGYNGINFIATKRGDYIAKTSGNRTFPWRVVLVSDRDAELADNDMAQRLAAPSRITDVSWIKPGKVAWDWWNTTNLTQVDFKAGMNMATYKYFIDFAAANQIEYIIIDEGWSRKSTLMESIPELNIQELVDYGKGQKVGIILWASWHLTNKEVEAVFPHYAKMGVKGFKVDFFDSDDQMMMQSMYKIAKAGAANKLLLDYHGMKPFGIQRTYPNIVNFEGVKGLENFKWAPVVNGKIRDDAPRYDVTIPYIRMLAGPVDYTPGAMTNATREFYHSSNRHPMSQGTRVHQMAMYTVFEAPLQMLADSPSKYKKEQECTDFITKVPTTFDQTIALDGEVGEYVILARRKADVWYIGALTNWTEREKTIDFSFLGDGKYEAEVFRDGINSDVEATDYRKEIISLSSKDRLTFKMFPGGGWTARIYKVLSDADCRLRQ